ncbi:hypothetical protein Cgig2_001257 [Carnegiea gigantea]|uniref:Peptide transporter n=1 Tax=Carnegiea gigantea TaxID=171969 RepID=A0A9Q1JRS9_9CARY|nr:hypothetical protein Cgig2_001257 [Carnegiea gigantea]
MVFFMKRQNLNSAIEGSRKLDHTDGLMWLDKAAVLTDDGRKTGDFSNPWRLCSVTQVEELKILVRMFPIWAAGIVFSAVYSQMSTVFVEQGMVMDRTIGSFTIPAASISTCDTISVIFSLAKRRGLVDENVLIPLNIFWQIPQFFLVGAAEMFTFIGQLEFFYDQSPDAMRSLCSAPSLLTTALGSYLNSLILIIVAAVTSAREKPGWIPDNLNKGLLDNFFWLLAGLSF